MSSMLRLYKWCNERRRLFTMPLNTAIFFVTGDAISQTFIQKKSPYDTSRGIRFLTCGLFIAGPMSSGWLVLTEKYLKGLGVKQMMLSMMVFQPAFIITSLGVMDYWKNRSAENIKEKIKQNFIPVYVAQLTVIFISIGHMAIRRRTQLPFAVASIYYLTWITYFAYRSECDKNNNTF